MDKHIILTRWDGDVLYGYHSDYTKVILIDNRKEVVKSEKKVIGL